jgi:hypothetical protein
VHEPQRQTGNTDPNSAVSAQVAASSAVAVVALLESVRLGAPDDAGYDVAEHAADAVGAVVGAAAAAAAGVVVVVAVAVAAAAGVAVGAVVVVVVHAAGVVGAVGADYVERAVDAVCVVRVVRAAANAAERDIAGRVVEVAVDVGSDGVAAGLQSAKGVLELDERVDVNLGHDAEGAFGESFGLVAHAIQLAAAVVCALYVVYAVYVENAGLDALGEPVGQRCNREFVAAYTRQSLAVWGFL